MKVTDFVKSDSYASMMYFRCGLFFYTVLNHSDKLTYVFPVPVEDLGNATITPYEKAITLMRYIRKAIEEKTMIKHESFELI